MWYYKSQSTVKVMSLILKWLLNVVRNRLTHFLIGIMTFTWVKSRSTCFVTLPNKDSFGSCAVSSAFGTGLHVSLKIMPNLSFDTWFCFWSRFSHFPWKENQKQSPIIEPYTSYHTDDEMPQPARRITLPLFGFQNKTPCICPVSPMQHTCCSLSLGRRPMHRSRVSMIRPVSCSFACVTHNHTEAFRLLSCS